jgi:hypothetical protein
MIVRRSVFRYIKYKNKTHYLRDMQSVRVVSKFDKVKETSPNKGRMSVKKTSLRGVQRRSNPERKTD